jgi:hypothetical protein
MSGIDVVNWALNGDKPSEKIGGKAEHIDRGFEVDPIFRTTRRVV